MTVDCVANFICPYRICKIAIFGFLSINLKFLALQQRFDAGMLYTIQAIARIVRLLCKIYSTCIILCGLIKDFHELDCLLPV